MRLDRRILVATFFALLMGLPAFAGEAAAGQAVVPAAACETAESDALLAGLDFTPLADGVVWTSGGCTASLTCPSNCQKHCSGTTSCSVGSNYVECDGQQHFCPSCNLSQYPGYPQCGLRQCPWCVCVSGGGDPVECCDIIIW